MQVGNVDITKEMMPSYDNFQQNPTHLYQLKQERLQNLLAQNNMQMMQNNMQNNTAPQTSQQSGRWNNE